VHVDSISYIYMYVYVLWNSFSCAVHVLLKLYDLFHTLESFWLTLDPCNVCMYVCMYLCVCVCVCMYVLHVAKCLHKIQWSQMLNFKNIYHYFVLINLPEVSCYHEFPTNQVPDIQSICCFLFTSLDNTRLLFRNSMKCMQSWSDYVSWHKSVNI
jgi:hypothetical protein